MWRKYWGQRNNWRSKNTTTFHKTHSLQQAQTSYLLRDKNNNKLSRSLSQKYKKYATNCNQRIQQNCTQWKTG